jgi:hypothetical protein
MRLKFQKKEFYNILKYYPLKTKKVQERKYLEIVKILRLFLGLPLRVAKTGFLKLALSSRFNLLSRTGGL